MQGSKVLTTVLLKNPQSFQIPTNLSYNSVDYDKGYWMGEIIYQSRGIHEGVSMRMRRPIVGRPRW